MKKQTVTTLMLFLLGVGIIGGIICCSKIHQYLNLAYIQQATADLYEYVTLHYWRSVFYFIGIYGFFLLVGLPAVAPLNLAGGSLFGAVPALIYSLIGAIIGTVSSFLLIRYTLGPLLKRLYAHRIKRFKEKLREHGPHHYLLMLHILGVVPFLFINAFAALADVPLITFIWTTIVGSIPIFFTYSLAGEKLSEIKSFNDIFSPSFIYILLILALLAFLPILLKRFKQYQGLE